MATLSSFENTPIREIIFTISFSNDVAMTCFVKFKGLPEIRAKFPNAEERFSPQVKNVSEQTATANFIKSGFVLKTSEQENKILQVSKGVFAFHKVDEYQGYEELFEELEGYWKLFKDCLDSELIISRVSLRYINFIEKEATERYQDLITIQVKHPFDEFQIDSSYNQLKFSHQSNEGLAPIEANLVTATVRDKNKNGIVLDIILNRNITTKEEELNLLFEGMRALKNTLFEKSITQTTIQKYI